jgi:hypothetical protein
MTLFDMLQSAQNGQALEALSRQYQLSLQQTQAAVDALLPAFSTGLKRQAADPLAFPNLFETMRAASPSRPEDPMQVFARQSLDQGNRILDEIFGSKEVSRAVADQAAALTGIGTDVLRAMLPAIAALLASSFVRAMTSQPQLEEMVRQMMAGAAGLGFPQPGARPTVQPNPNGAGLLGALLGSILQQGAQQSTADPGKAKESEQQDLVGQMFETGRQIQQAHLDAMESIFDAFTPKKKE